jgi:hypothetical protein
MDGPAMNAYFAPCPASGVFEWFASSRHRCSVTPMMIDPTTALPNRRIASLYPPLLLALELSEPFPSEKK